MAEAYHVDRTMRVLELLAFQPASAPQVAATLQIHPRTGRRILKRLLADRYLVYDVQARRYALGLHFVSLAGQVLARAPLAGIARAAVAQLHAETRGSAHLVVPSYDAVLCLVHWPVADGTRPRLLELAPVHCTASGKVLLGYREAWREARLTHELDRYTAATIVSPHALRREATEIVSRGYAHEREERAPGLASVAAPVFDAAGDAIAALGVTVPAERDLRALIEPVKLSAVELSRTLRGHGVR